MYNGSYLNMTKRGDPMESSKDLKYTIPCKCKDMFTTIPKGRLIKEDVQYLLLILLLREKITAELGGENLTDTGSERGTCHI